MQTRPFIQSDYPKIARIISAAYPEYPATPAELEFRDTHRDPKCLMARWVAEEEGLAVAFGEYTQRASSYHPRRFHVEVVVQPSHQGQGFGRALYAEVMEALKAFNPLSVRAMTREDVASGMRFLSHCGFVEDMRSFESRLDVAAFDPAPFAAAEARVLAQGIEFKTLRELDSLPGEGQKSFPDQKRVHDQKHYELTEELDADVPSPDPHTRMEKDAWRRQYLEDPNLLPDAYLFALDGETYVGVTMLFKSEGNTDLNTGLTGVRREYRRRGIALALKLRAIAWAKAEGWPVIKTWNESNNSGMLGINERLGFVRQPAWLDMVKQLTQE